MKWPKWFTTYSKWKPWTWHKEMRRLEQFARIKQFAYEKCCAERELVERQREAYRNKLIYAALLLQQKAKQVANLNQEANREIASLSETPGYQLADTADLPMLSHHARMSTNVDWMLLEKYQKLAASPIPKIEVVKQNDDR